MYTVDRKPHTKGVLPPLAGTIDSPLGFVVDRAIGPGRRAAGDFVAALAEAVRSLGPDAVMIKRSSRHG